MVCRIAFLKFEGSELDTLDLCEKIGFIMDEIFGSYGLIRKDVENHLDYETESDPDY